MVPLFKHNKLMIEVSAMGWMLVVIQSPSHVQLFGIPWTAARQASPFLTISRNLPKFVSIESVMPSNHLILCHPPLLLPSIFPSIRGSSNELAVHIRWPTYWSFHNRIRGETRNRRLLWWASISRWSLMVSSNLVLPWARRDRAGAAILPETRKHHSQVAWDGKEQLYREPTNTWGPEWRVRDAHTQIGDSTFFPDSCLIRKLLSHFLSMVTFSFHM